MQVKIHAMAPPLRKVKPDGTLYRRRPEVDAELDVIAAQPRSQVIGRCAITELSQPDYLPSECLLHLVRGCRSDNSDTHFETLFRALRRRVLARLPRTEVGRDAQGKIQVCQTNLKITDQVMGRFQELLVLDRANYEERLDYFEVNFDDAIAQLRLTARKKAWREENRSVPMTYDDETSELNAEIEEAAARNNPLTDSKLDDPDYRSRLDAAINALPEPERRVVELLRLGFPIDSTEPNVQTIVKIVGCVEKTARNRRDRAYEAIRKTLQEDEA
jgi:hypothetical protein